MFAGDLLPEENDDSAVVLSNHIGTSDGFMLMALGLRRCVCVCCLLYTSPSPRD